MNITRAAHTTKTACICVAFMLGLMACTAVAIAATDPFDATRVAIDATAPQGVVATGGAGVPSLAGACHLRIAGYNIAHARGNESGGFIKELAKGKNLRGIANLLADEKIDVVGLTEISKGDLRAGFRDQPEYIADHLGNFRHAYGENVSTGPGGFLRTQGNAIVSRYPIKTWKNHNLWRSDPKHEQRSCVEALLDLGKGQRLRIFVAHLSLDKVESKRQLEEIWARVQVSSEPVVLVGDFNLRPYSEGVKWLSELMRDTTNNLTTTYKNLPKVKIDYHFTRGNIVAGTSKVVGFKEGYSDHGCVINDYWLTK